MVRQPRPASQWMGLLPDRAVERAIHPYSCAQVPVRKPAWPLDETVIARTFAGWQIERMERAEVPSDTRMLDVLLARLATR
jgi:hypothetical protein